MTPGPPFKSAPPVLSLSTAAGCQRNTSHLFERVGVTAEIKQHRRGCPGLPEAQLLEPAYTGRGAAA